MNYGDPIYEAYALDCLDIEEGLYNTAGEEYAAATVERLMRKKDKMEAAGISADDPKMKSIKRAIKRAREIKAKYRKRNN